MSNILDDTIKTVINAWDDALWDAYEKRLIESLKKENEEFNSDRCNNRCINNVNDWY